ncbi:MAG: hypothetical protein WCY24_01635 [Lutispora sp.]
MKLIDLIYPSNRIVSIVGTYKNAGKTVTLNEIITQAGDKGIPIALISTGRDGEKRDVLTQTEKPPVFVKKGTIITTVENAIKAEYAGIEIFSVTDYNTPMGRVVIGRVVEDGYVEISGPYSSRTIKGMCEQMLAFGAKLVLIDGSLDRRASAAPFVSDGTILATGASLARSQDLVIDKTMHIINTYSIPRVDRGEIRDLAEGIIEEGKTGLINEDMSIIYVDTLTSLRSGSLIAQALTEDTRYVVLSGSATTDTLTDIMQNARGEIEILVKDGTRVFIPQRELHLLQRIGLRLKVVDAINIIAVTVNPYSPEGYYFDSLTFLENMRRAIPDIPVFDVVQGGNSYDY